MTLGDDNGDGKKLLVILFWTGVAFLLMILLHGCKTVYVPQPVYHEVHDTIKQVEVRDSIVNHYIYERDSSSFHQSGDTVRIEVWHWKRDYRYEKVLQAKIDSLSQIKRDSIPYPVPVEVEVPAEIKWWQKSLMWTGVVCILLVILYILIRLKLPIAHR